MNKGKKQTILSWFQRNLFDQRRKSRSYKRTILDYIHKKMTKFNIIIVKILQNWKEICMSMIIRPRRNVIRKEPSYSYWLLGEKERKGERQREREGRCKEKKKEILEKWGNMH